MICKFCGSPEIKIIYKNHPGYRQGTEFDIFSCNKCDVSFAFYDKIDQTFYDSIYPKDNPSDGYYGSHFERLQAIKNCKNPLVKLLNLTHIYYPIYSYLKNKRGLNILEVGCGYGYLTYALKKIGHNAFGVDISDNAINFALKYCGKNYLKIKDLDCLLVKKEFNNKFDLIVATEVIEHVPNPKKFIDDCFRILKKDGALILTTPNKSYFPSDSVWPTEVPPIHLFLFSPKSFERITQQEKLNLFFFNFSNSFSLNEKENMLINYFLSRRKGRLAEPIATKSGDFKPRKKGFLKKILRYVLIEFIIVRFLCNIVYKSFFKKINHSSTLGVLLSKTELSKNCGELR